jgi:hypothetical protein
MKICSKCKVEQDDKEYYSYYHSSHKKFYTRQICFTCMRKQSKQYKLKLKEQKQLLEQLPQEEKIIQPVVTELEIEVLEGQRRCTVCNEVKDIKTGFYSKRRQCIFCVRKYENTTRRKRDEEYKMENGGSERVPQTPGVYADEYQEQQVKEFLTLLGWKLNPNGVFSKEKFKTKDKVWEKPIKKYIKKNEKSSLYEKRDELVKLREEGLTFYQIGDIYGITASIAMRIIKDTYGK